MRTLIKKLLTFGLLMLLTAALLITNDFFIIENQFLQDYNAALIDKMERLRSLEEPKIILVGDSNVGYGFCSELLEQEFEMPVVNMGLNGGFGRTFCMNMIKPYVSNGDIVISCFGPGAYTGNGGMGDGFTGLLAVKQNPELWQSVRPEDYKKLIRAYPKYMFLNLFMFITHTGNRTKNSPFTRRAFNVYGDNAYERQPQIQPKENAVKAPEIDEQGAELLNEYNKFIKEKGATLLIAGYPIADGEYTPPKEKYEEYQKELERRLDCDLISNFTDYFIPYSYFFDSVLHLTNEGAKLRTELLIYDLQKWFDKKK